MKVVIVADHHYYKDPQGNVFVPSVYGYSYWKRYLNAFDEIHIVARGNKKEAFDRDKMILASGKGVVFHFITDFSGIIEMALKYFFVKNELCELLKGADLAIVRVPSPLSKLAVDYLIDYRIPFGIEVVADPALSYDESMMSSLIENIMSRHCKEACLRANGVAYVTKESLQMKYPSYSRVYGESDYNFETNYSSVDIPGYFFNKQKKYHLKNNISILHVSNVIDGVDKGHYICIDILDSLIKKGYNASIRFIGDGPEVSMLISYAKQKKIINNIHFVGRVSDMKIMYKEYVDSDFLILPSKTEGLPRCLIESMACGTICLASNVGGIPELLDSTELFIWNDTESYVSRIINLYNDTYLANKISKDNKSKALSYSSDVLQKKRDDFYNKLKKVATLLRRRK